MSRPLLRPEELLDAEAKYVLAATIAAVRCSRKPAARRKLTQLPRSRQLDQRSAAAAARSRAKQKALLPECSPPAIEMP
jgi:hypothetical protein